VVRDLYNHIDKLKLKDADLNVNQMLVVYILYNLVPTGERKSQET